MKIAKRAAIIILCTALLCAGLASCAAETDNEQQEERPPETITLDTADSDSVRIFWSTTYGYTADPEKDPELYEFISKKLPMTFSFVEMYPTDLKTGERYGMSFFSGEEELFTFKLYRGETIIYKGGVYKADDPDWSFTREELTELMEPYK